MFVFNITLTAHIEMGPQLSLILQTCEAMVSKESGLSTSPQWLIKTIISYLGVLLINQKPSNFSAFNLISSVGDANSLNTVLQIKDHHYKIQ